MPRCEREQVAHDLKPIYIAIDPDAAAQERERFDTKAGDCVPGDHARRSHRQTAAARGLEEITLTRLESLSSAIAMFPVGGMITGIAWRTRSGASRA